MQCRHGCWTGGSARDGCDTGVVSACAVHIAGQHWVCVIFPPGAPGESAWMVGWVGVVVSCRWSESAVTAARWTGYEGVVPVGLGENFSALDYLTRRSTPISTVYR